MNEDGLLIAMGCLAFGAIVLAVIISFEESFSERRNRKNKDR